MKFSVFIEVALEADHPASRPYLVRTIAPGGDQVDLVACGSLAEQCGDSAIAGFILIGVESLTLQSFGAVFSSH